MHHICIFMIDFKVSVASFQGILSCIFPGSDHLKIYLYNSIYSVCSMLEYSVPGHKKYKAESYLDILETDSNLN